MTIPSELITKLGIQDVPNDVQNALVEEGSVLIYTRVTDAVRERLPESVRPQFTELCNDAKDEEAQMLAAQHIPDLPALILEVSNQALLEYKEIIASVAKPQ